MTISAVVYLLGAELIADPKGKGQDALPILVNMFDTNVKITCTRHKNQVDNDIVWKYGDVPISVGIKLININGYYLVKRNAYGEIELTITKITAGTLGTYSCINRTNTVKTVELKIIEKPSIVNHANTTLMIPEGSTAALWCEVDSVIDYKIDWFLHDNKLDLPVEYTMCEENNTFTLNTPCICEENNTCTLNTPFRCEENNIFTQNTPYKCKENYTCTQNTPSKFEENNTCTQNTQCKCAENNTCTQNTPSKCEENNTCTQNTPSKCEENNTCTHNTPCKCEENNIFTQNTPYKCKENYTCTLNTPFKCEENNIFK
ncbi:KRAB [Mytilus coruscus]|uniref:KRAB n=1 Tax=Mytilus coruscus TaxID=42192 RepID=A0A6J8AZ14_MYTCO|nr:KRAB [Mytilus coruscus]